MGTILGCTNPRRALEEVKRIAARLVHADHLRSSVEVDVDGIKLGATWFASDPAACSSYSDDALGIILAGELRHAGARLNARQIAEQYRGGRLDVVLGSEGCYAVAVWDRLAGKLTLFADPMGTTPVCFGVHEGHFAFGPEAKAVLPLLGLEPRIARASALQFLMNGYLLGEKTIFEWVERLKPGELVEFDLRRTSLARRQYWDLRYEPEPLKMRQAAALLHEVLEQSHAEVLPPGERYQLFLTGGMDSRGILGFAGKLRRNPELSLSWAGQPAVPYSDPDVAGRLAALCGVPFETCLIDGTGFAEHAQRWAYISELQSDNGNSFASPVDCFQPWRTEQAKFVVLGDQMIGAGPIPRSTGEAAANILRTADRNPDGPLGRILRRESFERVQHEFDRDVAQIIEAGPNSDLKDVQDYLYFHTYIARWILVPGNFKSPLYRVRRPLMTRQVMEFARRLPSRLRVDKAVYVAMLQRHFPELARVPGTAAESGVAWSTLFRTAGENRRLVESMASTERLLAAVFGADFDAAALEAYLNGFFTASPAAAGQTAARQSRLLYDMRRRLSQSPVLAPLAVRLQPLALRLTGRARQEHIRKEHKLIMRLTMLSLLQDCIDQGWFNPSSGGTEARAAQPVM